MHPYRPSDAVRQRVLRRMGKAFVNEAIDAARTALVVVDMQNYFCAPGFPLEVPQSRAVVPNINRLARALRAAGGAVAWVQTSAAGAREHWRNFETRLLAPERLGERRAGLDEASDGLKLYPELDALPGDLRIKKIKYSAFIQGSSDMDRQLKTRNLDTLLIAGTLTNVCCESTARDAMMLDYKVVMVADANATLTDAEHAGALDTFMMFFGDVMGTEEAIARLVAVPAMQASAQ